MCGIVGIIDKRNKVTAFLLEKMCHELIHRGPDKGGFWISKTQDIGLAHQRLPIIDLSERANQPMISPDGKYVLVYNGIVYNYKNLRHQLEETGFIFYTNGDTEVVLNALICWKKKALIRFHGPFALAFCDNVKNKLLIAKDRIGEKPLHYYVNSDVFACTSEIKALEKLSILRKELNEESLVDYLTFGYIPSPKSIWKNVYKLEPGNYLEIDYSNKLVISEPQSFWKLSISPDLNLSLNEATEKFQFLLKEVSKEMLVSDVPIGVFLSGGVDSSGIVAALGNQNIPIRTFTIGFKESKFNELPYARQVSEIYKANHYQRTLSPDDVNEVFDFLVTHFDEPFSDFSYLPTYYVAKEAKNNVTVCLSGDGADELFCGYLKYPKIKRLEKINKIVPFCIRKKLARSVSNALPDYSDYKRQVDRVGYDEDEFLFDMMAINFKPKELKKIAGPSLRKILSSYSSRSVVNRHLDECKKMNVDLINKLRYLDLKMTLAENMLVKVDRVSMVNSVEVRPVYLHPMIVEFALQLPTGLLVNKNQGKFLLKKTLEEWLPKNILYRKKMGFGIPLTNWFFNGLNKVMKNALESLPGEWFNKSEVAVLLKNHLKGDRDFIMQIHCLVFLGKWLKNKNISI